MVQAWLWWLLAAVTGKPHLAATGTQDIPVPAPSAPRILHHIPKDPTAAFYAGQRMATAPTTLPLYIKLLNGQQGSKQAAELQFGSNYNTGYGTYPTPLSSPQLPGPDTNQGHQTLGVASHAPVPPALPSPPITLDSPVPVPVVDPEPVLSSFTADSESSLPTSVSVSQVIEDSNPTLSTLPLPVPSETQEIVAPFVATPVEAHLSEESEVATVVAEAPTGFSVAAPSLPEPVAENNHLSSGGGLTFGTDSFGFLQNMPIMYRLPSPGGTEEGHFIIIMPQHKTKLSGSTSSKVRNVSVFLATGVRPLKQHLYNNLSYKR